MRSENRKFRVKRELKFKVPSETLKRISKYCEGYGALQILADASEVNRNSIHDLLKDKIATKTLLEKVENGMKILKEEKAAA